MSETRRQYDPEFRAGAVRIVAETRRSVAEVARELGICEGTLGNWVRKDRAERSGAAYERPTRRLVGFAKVRLSPGESTQAQKVLDRSLLDLRIDGSWVRENLPVEFSVGLDAASARPL